MTYNMYYECHLDSICSSLIHIFIKGNYLQKFIIFSTIESSLVVKADFLNSSASVSDYWPINT